MIYSLYDDDFYCPSSTPKTLGDWVKNFRVKKLQMKRRLRANNNNLRVCAILSTALLSAESQLRLKQQERLNRCLQLQSKFHGKITGYEAQNQTQQQQHENAMDRLKAATINSKDVAINTNNNKNLKDEEKISNLWREELNGLDNLLRKTSSSGASSCAEAANQRFGESDETNMLKSIALLS